MKANESTVVRGKGVALVPYLPCHIDKYFQWMQDPWILEMTASEPLTREEEVDNQKGWHVDPKKCTFIVIDREEGEEFLDEKHNGEGMIGDVNLFYHDHDNPHCGELNVMIAEEYARRKGHGRTTVCLVMRWAVENLSSNRFIAKVSNDNIASMKLFESLGFEVDSTCDVFKETTFAIDPTLEKPWKEFAQEFEVKSDVPFKW